MSNQEVQVWFKNSSKMEVVGMYDPNHLKTEYIFEKHTCNDTINTWLSVKEGHYGLLLDVKTSPSGHLSHNQMKVLAVDRDSFWPKTQHHSPTNFCWEQTGISSIHNNKPLFSKPFKN